LSRIVSVRGSISSAIYIARWVNSECNSTYDGDDEYDGFGYGNDDGFDRAVKFEIFMMIRLIIKYWNRIDRTTSKLRKYQTS
jgi:hypothetical protein